MINSKLNPVEWSSLLYELEDAKDHLEGLVNKMADEGEIDEADYEVQVGHVFAHLNRSWNTRNIVGECTERDRELYTSFPKDIEPYG